MKLSILATAGMITLMSLLISANSSTLTGQPQAERRSSLIAVSVAPERYQLKPSRNPAPSLPSNLRAGLADFFYSLQP